LNLEGSRCQIGGDHSIIVLDFEVARRFLFGMRRKRGLCRNVVSFEIAWIQELFHKGRLGKEARGLGIAVIQGMTISRTSRTVEAITQRTYGLRVRNTESLQGCTA
jgi:hypothetical protein